MGSPANRESLYSRIASELRGQIDQGVWAPGDPLPSLRDQCALRGVSLTTVREAYALLEDEGRIHAVPQSGFRVSARGPSKASFVPEILGLDPSELGLFRIDRIYRQLHRDRPDAAGVNFSLATGEVPETLRRKVRGYSADLLRSRADTVFDYSVTPGAEELRVELSRYLARIGLGVAPGDLSVTSGCTEALTLALLAACREGDAVAVEGPCSFSLLSQLAALRLRPVVIPVGVRGLDLAALEAQTRRQRIAAAVVSPNFQNPNGVLMPEDDRRALVDLCGRAGVRIIEDDVYGDLHLGRVRPRPLKALEGASPVLYCTSFSKTMAPGLRVGLVAAGDLQPRVEGLGAFTSLSGNPWAQHLVARLLREGDYDRHLRRVRSSLGKNLAALRALLLETFPPGTRVSDPQGGLVLWVRLPPGLAGQQVYDAAVDRDILVAPGEIFGLRGAWSDHIRLNAGRWGPELEAGVRSLGQLVGELYRSTS